MKDRRITQRGIPLDYTCENDRFRTHVNHPASHPHGSHSKAGGSVTGAPLLSGPTYTLWLEHVEEKADPSAEWYWLMWYDPNGMPTMPMSTVFTKAQLQDMLQQLVRFVP